MRGKAGKIKRKQGKKKKIHMERKGESMRKTTKQLLAGFLSATLAVTALPVTSLVIPQKEAKAASVTLKNPRIVKDDSMKAGQKVTWDCIWFGSYPQREVVADAAGYDAIFIGYYNPKIDIIEDAALFQKLETAGGWSDNEITLDGNKYRRMKQEDATYSCSDSASMTYYRWKDNTSWHYFRYEPIKWRVLSTAGGQAFLQADLALDDQRYNNNYTNVTWETGSMRSWLNGYGPEKNEPKMDYRSDSFLQDAFTSAGQQVIRTTEVENADNLEYGTEGGNHTTDKIFLLSEQEVYGTKAGSYGFAEAYNTYDEARRRKSSTYAKAKGVWSSYSDGNCDWWLRTPGDYTKDTMKVFNNGYVDRYGRYVYSYDNGVCPALNLNLSSSDLWSYAGTVCSDEMRGSKPDNSNNGNNGNNNSGGNTGGNGNSGSNQVIEAGGNLILGEEKSAQVTGGAGKFFPGDYSLKTMMFPVEIAKETDPRDGSYTIKGTVGIGRSDLLDNKTTWDKYKSSIEDMDSYGERLDKAFSQKWGVKSLMALDTKKFKVLPKLSVVGYFETKYDKYGRIISDTGKIQSDAEWKGSASWQFATPIGPLYLSLEGGVKLSGKIGPKYDYEKRSLQAADGSLKLTPSITLEGGYGINKVATIGAQGKASVPITLIPATKGEFEASASVHISLIMVIDQTYPLALYKTTLWDTTKNKKSGKTLQIPQESFQEMDTAFAEDTSAWMGGTQKTRGVQNTIDTLQYAVLPSALPMQAEINGKKVLVFQAYDNSRSTLNSTALKYSVYQNGIWSEPKAVLDDGCADLYADMKVVNGKLVLAWQKEKAQVTGDVSLDSTGVMQKMAENSEIYYAEFDDSTGMFGNVTRITDNDACDMMPHIAENSDKVIVSWVRNDDASLMQESGTNRIYTATKNGTAFGTEQILTTASGSIDEYVVYENGGAPDCAFVGSSDGTNAVFGKDGNVFTEFADLGTEAEDGTITSLHYADGSIGCVSNGTLYRYDLADKQISSYTAGEGSFGGQVRYCSNGEKAGYIWSIYDEETGMGSLRASMKTADGYSEPVTLVEKKNQMWRYYSPILDENGNWQILANVLDTENNRNALVNISKNQEAKLKLAGLSIDEDDIQNGLTGVDYYVTNVEDNKIDQAEIEITLADGTKIKEAVPVDLEPGESTSGTVYMDLSKVMTTQRASISMAAEGQTDKSANTVQTTIGQPDIELQRSWNETTDEVQITAALQNQSRISAVTDLTLYADADQKTVLQKKTGLQIAANGKTQVSFTVKKKDLTYNENGAVYLTMQADVQGGDCKEDNNTAYVILYKEAETTKPSNSTTPQTKTPAPGTVIRTKNAIYRVTAVGTKGNTAALVKPLKKTNRTFVIPATIKSEDGKFTFKVTAISKNAFKKNIKLKKVTIGKNVSKIGANAFSGCKKLKNIKITSTQLTKKSVGKNAFKGIAKKAVIKVPKKKRKAYKNILKGKGQAKSVKIKK